MRHLVHYRRFHRLYVDVVAVVATALVGWFIWPSTPVRNGPAVLPTPSVAYGEVDPRTTGSLLYPGHFAFASPIGFGAASSPQFRPSSRWAVGAMLPFAPLLERIGPDEWPTPPASPAFPSPPLPLRGPLRTAATPPASAQFFEIEADAALQARSFAPPMFTPREIMGTNAPVGEVRAYVHVGRDGGVEHVLLPPGSGMTWEGHRPLEGILLRATASRAEVTTSGWVRIRWQLPPAK